MRDISKLTLCCGCGACANICPEDCIILNINGKGFYQPTIDEDKCISCGKCEDVCVQYNFPAQNNSVTKAFVFRSLNQELVLCSSSGGSLEQ